MPLARSPPRAPEDPHPKGRLAAVTRVRNEIEPLLQDLEGNKSKIKDLFTTFLTRVDNLYACCEESTDEKVKNWLVPHKNEIEEFRVKLSSLLYPTPEVRPTTRSHSVRSSTSSARVRLAEQRAKLQADKEFREKTFLLAEEKIKLQQSRAWEELQLQKNEQQILQERNERELQLLENELSSQTSIPPQRSVFPSPPRQQQNFPQSRRISPSPRRRTSLSPARRAPQTSERRPNPHFPQQVSPTQRSIEPHSQHQAQLLFQAQHTTPITPANNVPTFSRAAFAEPTTCPMTSTPNQADINVRIINVLEKQGEIACNIANFQRKSNLPKRDIQPFDGSDVTKFKSFITSFENSIQEICDNDCERFYYLQQFTTGRAREVVESCANYDMSLAFTKAKTLLINEYDDEYRVSCAYIEKLHQWPPIKPEDPRGIRDLSVYLLRCYNYLENMTSRNPLQNPKEMMTIINKLPYKLRERWRRRTHSIVTSHGTVYFKHLVDFVHEEAKILNQPVFNEIDTKVTKERKPVYTVRAVMTQPQSDQCKYCDFCKTKSDHYLSYCKEFEVLQPKEKSDFVRKAGLCFACLRRGHLSKECTRKLQCRLCKGQHPSVLHDPSKVKNFIQRIDQDSKVCSIVNNKRQKVMCPVIPVIHTVN